MTANHYFNYPHRLSHGLTEAGRKQLPNKWLKSPTLTLWLPTHVPQLFKPSCAPLATTGKPIVCSSCLFLLQCYCGCHTAQGLKRRRMPEGVHKWHSKRGCMAKGSNKHPIVVSLKWCDTDLPTRHIYSGCWPESRFVCIFKVCSQKIKRWHYSTGTKEHNY